MDTQSLIKIPGYEYNEYLLVLSPHEELWNKIKYIKEEFSQKYKSDHAKWGKPHITLANFIQFEMLEEKIANSLTTIAMGYHPFKVELKDFGSFPSHTIFMNIDTQLQIKNLVKELRPAQKLMTLNKDFKPHFIDMPHLTIARKLMPWQYEKAWLEYSNREFSGRFIANEMLLLKRPIDEKKYQIVKRLKFQNLPVIIKQAELFV